MMVLHSIHTNKRLKYLCPSVERIQSSADNKQASIVWCIPTLPTVAAPQWASSPAHNRRQTKPSICTESVVSLVQSYCRHFKADVYDGAVYTQVLKGKMIVRFNQSCTFGHHRWSLGGYFGVQYLAQGHFACRGPELMTFVSLELAA